MKATKLFSILIIVLLIASIGASIANAGIEYSALETKNDLNETTGAKEINCDRPALSYPHPFEDCLEWVSQRELMPAPAEKIDLSKYIQHEPIYIDGDSDFASQASSESWAGDGSYANPYIIENYDINASQATEGNGYPAGIKINNTTVYFIIRNCTIYDGKINYPYNRNHGIYLYSVQNGKIYNVTSYNNIYGIYLYSSSNNQVINCTVYKNSHGIHLSYYSSNNKITNCTVYNSSWSIAMYSSSNNNIITNCTVYNSSLNGFCLYYSSNNQITNCAAYNNPYGIYLYQSSSNNNQITNCAIYNNSHYGIYLFYSPYNQITNCNIYNNSRCGIYLLGSPENIITNNIFTNNGIFMGGDIDNCVQTIENNIVNDKPLYYFLDENAITLDNIEVGQLILVNCANFIIKNLDISYTYVGIALLYSSNNNIINCAVYNNSAYGIYLYKASRNNITNCNVYNNCYDGIYLYQSSSNNSITNCAVYNHSREYAIGIKLDSCSNDNKITNCSIYNNYYGIILIWLSNDNIVTNCDVHNNSVGIGLAWSSEDNIINCKVYNNSHGIWLLYASDNNKITNCSIYNNSDCGIYLYYASNNEIHHCNIYNNINYSVNNYNTESQYVANATYNWWGSADGPGGEGTGTGNNISKNVIYDPWLLQPLDLTPPVIIQTTPSDNEVDVAVDTTIVLIFSEPMDISTIPGNITIEPDTQISEYNWSSDNTILTLRFDYSLSFSTQYTVTINTNVQDVSYYIQASDGSWHLTGGNHLQLPYQFSFRTKDVTKPEITDIQSNPSPQEVHGYINITCVVTDNVAVSIVRVNIIGPFGFIPINETMIRIAGTDSYHYNTTYHITGTYYYYVWAKDTSGNSISSITDSFVIRDTTLPQISDIKATPEIQEVYGWVNITCTVTDNVAVNIVKINITGPAGFTPLNNTMSRITGNNDSYYYNFYYSILGTYYYHIWADDTSNNRNETKNYQFTIQDTAKPQILNVQAVPLTQAQGGWMNITCTVTDNVGVSIVRLNIVGPAGFTPINTTMIKTTDTYNYYYNTIYFIAGTYYYYVWAKDTSGNSNSSITYSFIINVRLSSPAEITKNSLEIIWTQNNDTDFANYTIYRSTQAGVLGTVIQIIPDRTNISFEVTGLEPNTTYYFTIRVYKIDESYSDSEQVSATTLAEEVKEAPPVNLVLYAGVIAIVIIIVIAVFAIARPRKREQ